MRSVCLLLSLYRSPFLSYSCTRTQCPVYFQCVLFYGFLAAQWKSSINRAMLWNISQIRIQLCGLSTTHNNMMHLAQSVNHHGAADLCTYGLIYLSCCTHMCIHAGTLSDEAGGQVRPRAVKCTVISVTTCIATANRPLVVCPSGDIVHLASKLFRGFMLKPATRGGFVRLFNTHAPPPICNTKGRWSY